MLQLHSLQLFAPVLAAAVLLSVEAALAAIVVPVVVEAARAAMMVPAVDPLVSGTCTSFWQLHVELLELDPAILCVSEKPLLESRRLRVYVKLPMEFSEEGTYSGNLPRRVHYAYEQPKSSASVWE